MIQRITLAATALPLLLLAACAAQDPAAQNPTAKNRATQKPAAQNQTANSSKTASETQSPPADADSSAAAKTKSSPAKPILGNVTETLLADHRGKIVILNFFATWCPPCMQEIQEFKADLWPKIKSNPNVVLLSIAEDDDRADVERWLKREKLDWTFLWDKGGTLFSQHAKEATIPLLVVIDKAGKVTANQAGFAPGLAEALLKHLKELDT